MNRFKASTADFKLASFSVCLVAFSSMCATPAEVFGNKFVLLQQHKANRIFLLFVCLLVFCLDFVLFYYGKGAGQSNKSTNFFGGEKPLMRAAASEGG